VRTESGRLVRVVRDGSGRLLHRASLSLQRAGGVVASGAIAALSQRSRAYHDLEASTYPAASTAAASTAASTAAASTAAASTAATASAPAKRPPPAPWRLWRDRLVALAAFWLFCAFGLFLLFSELWLILYFFGWGGSTPIGLAIYGHEQASVLPLHPTPTPTSTLEPLTLTLPLPLSP